MVSDERMSQGHGGGGGGWGVAVKLQDSSGAESKPALMTKMIIRKRWLIRRHLPKEFLSLGGPRGKEGCAFNAKIERSASKSCPKSTYCCATSLLSACMHMDGYWLMI